MPEDFYARVARIGKDMGAKVVVDTSDEALRLALSEGVYLIKPNIREFRELIGAGMAKEPEARKDAEPWITSQKSVISLWR